MIPPLASLPFYQLSHHFSHSIPLPPSNQGTGNNPFLQTTETQFRTPRNPTSLNLHPFLLFHSVNRCWVPKILLVSINFRSNRRRWFHRNPIQKSEKPSMTQSPSLFAVSQLKSMPGSRIFPGFYQFQIQLKKMIAEKRK